MLNYALALGWNGRIPCYDDERDTTTPQPSIPDHHFLEWTNMDVDYVSLEADCHILPVFSLGVREQQRLLHVTSNLRTIS